MADSKRDTSNYVRSAYSRRPGSGRSEYGQSKSQGQVWSIIIVLLLIVILAGGAVWIYLSRQGGGAEVANTENEALIPQTTASTEAEEPTQVASADTESEAVVPQATAPAAGLGAGAETKAPSTNATGNESAASAEGAAKGQNAEDEFAAILKELGINDTGGAGQEEKAAGAGTEAPENAPQKEQHEMMAQKETEEVPPARAFVPEGTEAPQAEEVPPARAFVPEGTEAPEKVPPVEAPPAVASSSEDTIPSFEETAPQVPNTVVVQPGDSLSRIAQRVYGDPGKWRLIYEANQDILESPDRVLVGMKLTIPPEN